MNATVSECAVENRDGLLCRLSRSLRLTIEKKFLLAFVLLLVVATGDGIVVQTTMEKTHGMAELVNVAGSLRWRSLGVHAAVVRFAHGDLDDRREVAGHLDRLDVAVRFLERGGAADAEELSEGFHSDVRVAAKAVSTLRRRADQVLSDIVARQDYGPSLGRLHQEVAALVILADGMVTALERQIAKVEARSIDSIEILWIANLVILSMVMLAVRLRIVSPLKKLADASLAFAAGRYDVRSGFRSHDEIGQLALAFDHMAECIENDVRRISENADELQKRDRDLRKFSRAIECSPVSVVIFDDRGRVEYVNPKFLETHDCVAADVIGRCVSDLLPSETPARVHAALWTALESGLEWKGESAEYGKDGEVFWEEVCISPLRDDRGRTTHFVSLRQDITQRKLNEEALVSSKSELERLVDERTRKLMEANKELEAFGYSISHDLRAPLRAISGFTGVLEESLGDRVPPESREYLGRIQRATRRMGMLIDDLLEISRLGRKDLERRQIDLSEMATAILEELSGTDQSRKMRAQVQARMSLQADPVLLRAVMENLIGNAWKYTSKRDLAEIDVGCMQIEGERVFYVRDNGVGFDMHYAADRLFVPFRRLHTAQEFEGSGIGLAMVRRIVSLHGGRVWASAAPDAGATFYFTIPES